MMQSTKLRNLHGTYLQHLPQQCMHGVQAANVHAILESGPFVHKVQARLNDSIALIDDLDETLAIFDLKLRHMREDIAAIESRNNRCLPYPSYVTEHHYQSMLISCGMSQRQSRGQYHVAAH